MSRSLRLYSALLGALFLLAGSAGADRAVLPLGDDDTVYVQFPADFTFTFGGVAYKGVWVNTNGNLTFGRPEFSFSGSASGLITQYPMIAGLWVDLDLTTPQGGTLTAGRISPTEFEVRWANVPNFGAMTTNSFAIVLVSDGSFRFEYGAVTASPSTSSSTVVGFATGNANTNGVGASQVLTGGPFCPTQLGTGSESSIFQVFTPANAAAALSNRSLCFAPAQPASGRLTMYDDDIVEIALTGFYPTLWGNRYTSLWVNSNGSISFGGGDYSYTPTPGDFLGGVPFGPIGIGRIAAAWRDLNPAGGPSGNPGSGGVIQVNQGANQFTVSWTNVPEYANPIPNTLSVTVDNLNQISFSYGSVSPAGVGNEILTGVTGGYPITTGSEPASVLGMLPSPIATGVPAVYEFFTMGNYPYSNQNLLFNGSHANLSSAIPLGDEDAVEVLFPGGFTFPFGGRTYSSAWINSNGYLGLGFNIVEFPPFSVPPPPAPPPPVTWYSYFPRIAPFWTDLAANPGFSPEGSYGFTSGGGAVTFSWNRVPEFGGIGENSCNLILGPGKSFQMVFGTVTANAQLPITGYTTGGGKSLGTEPSRNLSALTMPVGRGTESVFHEDFRATPPFDLSNTTVGFVGAGPILYQDPILSPGITRVAIDAAPNDGGLSYVAALALGNIPGITVPGCSTIPLNLDAALILSLSGALMQGNIGTLDRWGQKDGWPVSPPSSPMQVTLPAGLSGLGITAWMSFVTFPSGGACPFRTIAPAAPFPIP